MPYLLCYGSLRATSSRGFNYQRFGSTQRYLRTLILSGYQMVSLNAYPAVYQGDGSIVVELHEIGAANMAAVRMMELESGYSETVLDIPLTDSPDGELVKASLFYAHPEQVTGLARVLSGDWA